MLGKLRAGVMRQHAQDFGVQFIDIQNPAALRRYFGCGGGRFEAQPEPETQEIVK